VPQNTVTAQAQSDKGTEAQEAQRHKDFFYLRKTVFRAKPDNASIIQLFFQILLCTFATLCLCV